MAFTIESACGCHIGKVRRCNQDNFLFYHSYLNEDNSGLDAPLVKVHNRVSGTMLAVFDGMGGENFGETAAFASARALAGIRKSLKQHLIPTNDFLNSCVQTLNSAVIQAQQELLTDRMGTTVVGLYTGKRHAYIWNVGDSRGYLLRNGVLNQLSIDHSETGLRPGSRKAPLTQYLGIAPEELQIEPHITCQELNSGDRYLLCSDGLTDMLTDEHIRRILLSEETCADCVRMLIKEALACGGKDNITAIVSTIHQRR